MQLQQMHINIFLSSLLRILFYYTKITPPVRQHQRGKTILPPGSAGGGMSIHAYHGGAFHVFVERSIENITFK